MSRIDSTRQTMSNSGLTGSSPKFGAVLDRVNTAASASCTIPMQGERGTGKEQLYRESLALRDDLDQASMFEEMVGTSKPFKTVHGRTAKVALNDSTVSITGETGTGKGPIAPAVHKRSRRSGHAFVSVNNAALAPPLISSELFGHENGALR